MLSRIFYNSKKAFTTSSFDASIREAILPPVKKNVIVSKNNVQESYSSKEDRPNHSIKRSLKP